MNTIVFRTTNECNLRCTYCYDNNNHDTCESRKIANDTFANNLGYIIEDIKKILVDARRPNFIFHGGEPLLVDTELLSELCARLERYRPIRFSLQTNGTLITEKTIAFFKKHQIHVGISLDGATATQNAARLFKEGGNSFQVVLKKIALLQKLGVDFGVIMSISKLHCQHEQQIYDFIADQKIKCNIRPVYPSLSGDNSVVMTPEEYITFFNNLFDIWFDDTQKRVSSFQIHELASALSNQVAPTYHERVCECSDNCFHNFISLDTNGEVYSCNRLYNVQDFHYGNIRTMSLNQIHAIIDVLLKKRLEAIQAKCSQCSLYGKCHVVARPNPIVNSGLSTNLVSIVK